MNSKYLKYKNKYLNLKSLQKGGLSDIGNSVITLNDEQTYLGKIVKMVYLLDSGETVDVSDENVEYYTVSPELLLKHQVSNSNESINTSNRLGSQNDNLSSSNESINTSNKNDNLSNSNEFINTYNRDHRLRVGKDDYLPDEYTYYLPFQMIIKKSSRLLDPSLANDSNYNSNNDDNYNKYYYNLETIFKETEYNSGTVENLGDFPNNIKKYIWGTHKQLMRNPMRSRFHNKYIWYLLCQLENNYYVFFSAETSANFNKYGSMELYISKNLGAIIDSIPEEEYETYIKTSKLKK